MYALEDLNERNIESEFNHAIDYLENNGSDWLYDRIASLTIDLYENLTPDGSRYNALLMKKLSVWNI